MVLMRSKRTDKKKRIQRMVNMMKKEVTMRRRRMNMKQNKKMRVRRGKESQRSRAACQFPKCVRHLRQPGNVCTRVSSRWHL